MIFDGVVSDNNVRGSSLYCLLRECDAIHYLKRILAKVTLFLLYAFHLHLWAQVVTKVKIFHNQSAGRPGITVVKCKYLIKIRWG